MKGYYPLLLHIAQAPCLVVGGGKVAERKALSLLECGAKVRVVSPRTSLKLKEMAAVGQIELLPRHFKSSDIKGISLVIAATNNGLLNQKVAAAAGKKGILTNVVDNPSLGNFIVPSVVRRGDLLIAIATSGESPALARKLREEIEAKYGEEYAQLLLLLSRWRRQLLEQGQRLSYRQWHQAINRLLKLLRSGHKVTPEEVRSTLMRRG